MADQRMTGDKDTILRFELRMQGRLLSYASRCSRGGGYQCTVNIGHGPTLVHAAAVDGLKDLVGQIVIATGTLCVQADGTFLLDAATLEPFTDPDDLSGKTMDELLDLLGLVTDELIERNRPEAA